MTKSAPTFLITGLPTSFLAQRLLTHLLARHEGSVVKCLVGEPQTESVEHLVQRLPGADQRRVEIVRGDATAMDFGLSGARFLALAKQIDVIHHCTCANYAGVNRDAEQRTYIGSSGEVLELALASEGHLTSLVHWSSAMLAQPSSGRATETEWRRPSSFRSRVDEMRFRAEVLMRDAMTRAPITVLRPTIIVGDSATGEIDRSEGPYALFAHMLATPAEFRVTPPGRGDQLCHFVPIDYVLESGVAIASDPRSHGRTFHLTDERPSSVRRVFELIEAAIEHPAVAPRIPWQLGALLRAAPGGERIAHVPRAFIDLLATDAVYDARNARELLAGTSIECPSIASYLKLMLARVQREQESLGKVVGGRRHPHFEEMEDPLDQ